MYEDHVAHSVADVKSRPFLAFKPLLAFAGRSLLACDFLACSLSDAGRRIRESRTNRY